MLLYVAHRHHRWSDVHRTADHCRHALSILRRRFFRQRSQPCRRRSRPKEHTSPDQRNSELFTAALYLTLSFSCPSLSLTPRVWNHSEVVLVLSPPTSHLLNEPSIDRRHFAVSRFPSHLAAAPALPPFRTLISFPAVLPLSPMVRSILSSRYWLKIVQKFLLHTEKRDLTVIAADLDIREPHKSCIAVTLLSVYDVAI